MKKIALLNATIVNEGLVYKANILIEGDRISLISETLPSLEDCTEVYDFENLMVLPGIIDDQVHFREPGLTHKGDIETESKACLAGGITTYFEMPNTSPPTISISELETKFQLASKKSFANYSFYLGASNTNIEEIKRINPKRTAGVKVFMGSSTGNLLVDDESALESIFKYSPVLIAAHCEDEETIKKNEISFKEKYGDDISFDLHPEIRSTEACYISSSKAVELAKKHNTRLHILHISTEKELELFDSTMPLAEKRITAEACVHHLYFSDKDYRKLGWRIKWNPSIKTTNDRNALIKALNDNKIDVIASDHAPHAIFEKDQIYWKSPSGGPLVQHSLLVLLELHYQGLISLPGVVSKMCHAPAELFRTKDRGFIKVGYYADLVVLDLNSKTNVTQNNLLYKCGWSPFEGVTFNSKVIATFINGHLGYFNGSISDEKHGMEVEFSRA